MWKDAVKVWLKVLSLHFPAEEVYEDSHCPGLDSNWAPHKQESLSLLLHRPAHLFCIQMQYNDKQKEAHWPLSYRDQVNTNRKHTVLVWSVEISTCLFCLFGSIIGLEEACELDSACTVKLLHDTMLMLCSQVLQHAWNRHRLTLLVKPWRTLRHCTYLFPRDVMLKNTSGCSQGRIALCIVSSLTLQHCHLYWLLPQLSSPLSSSS